MSGKEKANIIRESLLQLYEVGVYIASITCSGPASHFTMLKELGCVLDNAHNMQTWFEHPLTEHKVYCVLDVCHVLKVFRNNLATLKRIMDPEGQPITWRYIADLHELHEQNKSDKEIFHLEIKLKSLI